MAAYRLYAMDGLGRINLADWIHAESDEEAVAKARQVEHGRVSAKFGSKGGWCARFAPTN